jgi:hypothetical protein
VELQSRVNQALTAKNAEVAKTVSQPPAGLRVALQEVGRTAEATATFRRALAILGYPTTLRPDFRGAYP